MNFISRLYHNTHRLFTRFLFLPVFRNIYLPHKVKKIRKKDKIRFLFVLQILPQWKTEQLYVAMLHHPRFEPILGIIPCLEYPGEEQNVINYCKEKGYDYILLSGDKTLTSQIDVDFVTHQQPYKKQFHPKHYVTKNLKIPCVVIPYAMNSIVVERLIGLSLYLFCWKQYFENESSCNERKPQHLLKGKNYAVTGLPMMDELILPKENYPSPWPEDGRKRIIYAPHHTIADLHSTWIAYSTFLENGEFLQQMRDKYKEEVYFVFKPHPMLYKKLCQVWGKEKTDEYYQSWENAENSHIESGKYMGLFKHSHAMIHDCGSFTVEYLYTHNPVMYLLNDNHHEETLSQYVKEAFNLHYKGHTHEEIEQFILDVIQGKDPLKNEREIFYNESLLPPHGKTACENIINSILGIEEYSH